MGQLDLAQRADRALVKALEDERRRLKPVLLGRPGNRERLFAATHAALRLEVGGRT